MTDMPYKLALSHILHRGNHIFFTKDGGILYGKDEDNLNYYPQGLEVRGEFPPIFTEDLRQAFKLGMKVGKEKQ